MSGLKTQQDDRRDISAHLPSQNECGYRASHSPDFNHMLAQAQTERAVNDLRSADRKPQTGRYGQKAKFAIPQAMIGTLAAETVQSFATRDHWSHPKLAEVTAAAVAASPPLAIGAVGVFVVGGLALAAGGSGGGGDCCFVGDPCGGGGGGCGNFDSSKSKWKRDFFLLAPLASIPGALVGESAAGGVVRNAISNAIDKLPDTVKSHASAQTLQKLHQYLPLGTAPLAAAAVAGTLIGGAALGHRWWNSSRSSKNSCQGNDTGLLDLRGEQPETIV